MSILDKTKERQAKYWQNRAERIILAAEKDAAEMLAGQLDSWRNTERAIIKEVEAFYGRYARETELPIEEIQRRLSPSELKTAKEDIARYYEETERLGLDPEYKKYLRSLSARAYMSRLEELKLHIRQEIEKLTGRQQTAFHDGLSRAYEESYYRNIFNIQQGAGFGSPFTLLNTEMVERVVRQKWLGNNYSNRIWENKDRLLSNLERIIPQGMALGRNPRVLAKDIEAAMQTGQRHAERLARTEFNHLANDAAYDGYREAGVEAYEFLATLDYRTSDMCAELDGKIFQLSERMVGVNYPPIHPYCRSTTVPHFPPDEIDAMFGKGQRIARDPAMGKNYYVPEDMSYKEWHNEHVLQKSRWNGIIGTTTSRGNIVVNIKDHFFDQGVFRSISAEEAKDALIDSLHVTEVKYNSKGEPSVQYIGSKATVAFNPDTNTVLTTWRTGRRNLKKYGKREE